MMHPPQKSIIQQIKASDTIKQKDVIPTAGRNDPCPCGSGKKYKQCHGK